MSKINRILIFANGMLFPSFLAEIKRGDFIVAVDGAALWLLNNQVMPDAAIGDFDSVTKRELETIQKKVKKVLIYPEKKDYTDLHLAVNYAIDLNPQQVVIFGATGSRLDHTLAALQMLILFARRGIEAKIKDNSNELTLVESSVSVKKSNNYKYLSVVPFTKRAVVSIGGCRYNVGEKVIKRGETVGISNQIIAHKANIEVKKGTIMLIRSRD